MGKRFKAFLGILAVFVFFFGFFVGAYGKKIPSHTGDREIYEYLKTFSDVIELVKKNYVDEVNDKDIVYSAIKGMLESLDPHSSFLTPEQYKEIQTETKGEFGGIGIEVTIKDGLPTVITPIEDTPAFKAGLKAGDYIIRIDGKPTKNMSLIDIVKMIRGAKGKPVTLSIMRDGFVTPKDFKIVRDIIEVKSIKSRLLEDNYGYIRVVQFQEKTSRDLENALKELTTKNKGNPLKGIILDLRNNPGGLLEQAVEVTDRFISEGLIVYIEGRKGSDNNNKLKFYAHKKDDFLGAVVVLVNEGSASASEIVAGALQDYKKAIVVGAKTFGKGSVQTIFPLPDGSAVRLTTAKYFTPKGRSIQAEGITPDITIDSNIIVKGKDRLMPLKERDLERHLEIDKKELQQRDGGNNGVINEDDFQLSVGLQILKGWDALRGK
jgi:carboxyl-terminal processing protease